MPSEQSSLLNQVTTPFMSHFTLLKFLPQAIKGSHKQSTVPRRTFSLWISSAARVQELRRDSWTRRTREREPCAQNTAHCAREKLEEFFFFRNRPAHSLRFAVCLWRALVHHKLRPPLKYSEEQMVLKHDCSPPPTHGATSTAHTLSHTHTHSGTQDTNINTEICQYQSHSLSKVLQRALA